MSDWDNWSDRIKGYGISGLKLSYLRQDAIDDPEDELYHHGILGMKWGIRRYQNPDGSLTEAGRRHYGKAEVKNAKKEERQQKRDAKSAAKLERKKEKNPKLYTDEEIKKRIERLKIEKQYKDLVNESKNGQFARNMVKDILTDAKNIGALAARNAVNFATEKPWEARIADWVVKGLEGAGKLTSGLSGMAASGASLAKTMGWDKAGKREAKQQKELDDQKRSEKIDQLNKTKEQLNKTKERNETFINSLKNNDPILTKEERSARERQGATYGINLSDYDSSYSARLKKSKKRKAWR